MSKEEIAAVILAAGSSSRMGGVKKEFQRLKNGYTVLESSVRAFASAPSIDVIVIAVSADTETAARDAALRVSGGRPRIIFAQGGDTRRASARNALLSLSALNETRYVLIHDGARPYVSVSLIENIIAAVKKHGAVIPLLPLVDTPKEFGALNAGNEPVNEEPAAGKDKVMYILKHLKRANVGAAQTPQAFRFPEILRAYEDAAEHAAREEFTDDAEIWGRLFDKAAVIAGDPANKKITFKEDLI